MSQPSTVTTVRRAPARGATTARDLRVVGAAEAAGSPWFPVALVALLLAGLGAVLMLNTSMARDSFEAGRLEARSAELGETRDVLVQEVDAQAAPQHLAQRARSLGMVPADSAAFVDLQQGTVLGVARPAEQPEGFSVDAAARATGTSAPATSSTPTSQSTKTTTSTKATTSTTSTTSTARQTTKSARSTTTSSTTSR